MINDSMIGESIGSYRIVAKLGEGGMGAVYLGEHQRITRTAAIKVLLPELSRDQQVVARFFNEARATSDVRHPGIVEVVDCDVLPSGSAYIVMEHLQGESLGALLRRGERLAARRAAVLARHIADALAAAHDKQIVHRDLKPDNVFVLADGTQPIKILDFGIAKLLNPGGGEGFHRTRTGILLGTPTYMSPEQCRGAGDIDQRTDVYALGCILFEMITGRPPFTSTGFGELIQGHLLTPPPSLRSIDPTVPAALDDLVSRMLAKAPGDRPQTMGAIVTALDEIIAAAPPTVSDAAAPFAGAGAGRQVRTVLLPQNQPFQTTLGSASSEQMDVVRSDDSPGGPGPRRRRAILATASAAAVVVVIGIWLVARPRAPAEGGGTESGDVRKSRAAVEPDWPSPAGANPAEDKPDDRVAARAAVVPDKMEALAPPPPPRRPPAAEKPPVAEKVKVAAASDTASPAASRSRAGDKVKVVITSEPSGADVCFAKDLALLGKTKLEWRTEKSAAPTKLLVRLSGYRGQEISIVPDHETKARVRLHALGPDDPADIDNCARPR